MTHGGDEFVFHPLHDETLADVAKGDAHAGCFAAVVDNGAGGVFDRHRSAVEAIELAAAGPHDGVEAGAADAAVAVWEWPVGAAGGMDVRVEALTDKAHSVRPED